jgi:hypothetical protein
MLTEPMKAEIRRLVDAVDEDGPSTRLFTQLELLLAGDAEARRYYLRLMGLRANLRQMAGSCELELEAAEPPTSIRVVSNWPESSPRRRDLRKVSGLAVLVLLAVVVSVRWRGRTASVEGPVAAIVEMRHAWWNSVAHPKEPRARLTNGQWLLLDRGSVGIRFDRGADVTIKGPSRFQILSDQSLMLAEGSLTAEVPEAARGFTVKTPGPDVVDFGTEFAVVVPGADQVDVHVKTGRVAVKSAANSAFRGAELSLTAAQSLRVLVARGVTQPLPYSDQLFAGLPEQDAEVFAIQYRPGQLGNQQYHGKLGTDFVVHQPIVVTELGVFDSEADGLKRPLTCELWSRDPAGTPDDVSDDRGLAKLAMIEFTPRDPGALMDGSRVRKLGRELTLAPGHYSIVAYGFGGAEPNGNDFGRNAFSQAIAFNGSGGLVSFLGPGRFTAYARDLVHVPADSFPMVTDPLPPGEPNHFAAGTFRYRPAAQ